MNIKPLTASIFASPQIAASDMQAIKNAGFRAIICNRPDGEESDQPTFAEIATAASAQGLEAVYLPVTVGSPRDEDADAFGTALATLPGPVLAYCRSGMRSATMWSLAQANTLGVAEILATTNAAGYDMAGIAHRIVNRSNAPADVL